LLIIRPAACRDCFGARRGGFLVRGIHYLQIARDLGRESIPGVFVGEFDESVVGGCRQLTQEEIDQSCEKSSVEAWHVFYFSRSVTSEEVAEVKKIFDEFLAECISRLPSSSISKITEYKVESASGLFAVKFVTPVESKEWADRYRRKFDLLPYGLRFISYQGRRLPTS
jgi:hypothetical protein